MGRRKLWSEDMQSRFAEGTFDRIDGVLNEGETRTDFVRVAVERELGLRECKPKKKASAKRNGSTRSSSDRRVT